MAQVIHHTRFFAFDLCSAGEPAWPDFSNLVGTGGPESTLPASDICQ